MINCGSVFPAYPNFVYPVPQSTTQAGSCPAIFLLACCCCCCCRLLCAGWGQGWAAGGRSYLIIHGWATLSIWGRSREAKAVAREKQSRSAATTSATRAGRQSPPCPAAASSPSPLLPTPAPTLQLLPLTPPVPGKPRWPPVPTPRPGQA